MTSGAWSDSIPGIGTFFVGIDVAPGRYRCDDGKGGWWVRFTGPGGGDPVGSWPLPAGPTEIEISPTDFAFETHIGTYWRRIAPARDPRDGPAAEPRPVADPTLRAELDTLVARRRPLLWLAPLTVLGLGLIGSPLLGSLWLVGLGMLAVLVALGTPSVSLDLRRARELERRRDRYLTPEDFDGPARALLVRTQGAVDAVRDSEVNREGLLDTVDNSVTLPRQEWEIAQVLARQSRLRGEQEEMGEAAELPEVKAALRPLREKLDVSVEAVTRRVEALERYADRVRAADEALRAQRHLEALSEKAHEYDELLADTVRDDLAVPAIERLTEQSDTLVRTLRARLAQAAEAGDELPPAP
ncbi:apolipoprotein A1/A4/E family protein [Actinomadura graeca]|uniref:Apolipoprotein A1/A4/E family protein n=1 Tax=Actinomadura graeca TaxID=2750812 RepID=A0ABX8R5F4_9ACTN|nr:apolipoprotein A1/A4/E family protein [Actinomadura graeca]QXJ24957.1 apolipoprotein A1/A4/E family protein [Actinomadura graeca]